MAILGLTWVSDWRPGTFEDTNLTAFTLTPTWPSSNGATDYPDRYAYYGGYDIHVVRGSQTDPLRNHLFVLYDAGPNTPQHLARASDYMGTGALNFGTSGVSFEFKPRVVGVHSNTNVNFPNYFSFNSNSNNDNPANDTIYVDSVTGVIKVWPAYSPVKGPEFWNFNFIMDVKMMCSEGTFNISIRVHVHDSITKAWLTPSVLTLRPDADHWRLSVLAQFSDGTVGDISHHPGLVWTFGLGSHSDVTFSEGANPSGPNDYGFLKVNPTRTTALTNAAQVKAVYTPLTVVAPPANPPISVPQAHPAVLMTGTSSPSTNVNNTAQIEIGLSFKDGAFGPLHTADCVPRSRGLATFNEVPNILFLPDGYCSPDQVRFDSMIDGLVNSLDQPSKEPFKTFLNPNYKSINIWRAFFPSNQHVCSVLSEVVEVRTLTGPMNKPAFTEPNTGSTTYTVEEFIDTMDGILASSAVNFSLYWAMEVINPNVTTAARYRTLAYRPPQGKELNLRQLVNRVGYPTVHDLNPLLTSNDIVAKWNLLRDPGNPAVPNLTLDLTNAPPGTSYVYHVVFYLWRMLANRRMIDEQDTAFGISFDTKPKADANGSFSSPAGIFTGTSAARTMTYNPQRASRHNINPLLQRYENKTPTAIGNIWSCSVTPPPVPPNPPVIPGYDRGKDYDYVVFLSTGYHYGGMVTPDGLGFCRRACVAVSTTDSMFEIRTIRVNPSNSNDLRIRLNSSAYVPASAPNITCQQTTAHELAHTFLLGDEYGGRPGPPAGRVTFPCSLNIQNEAQVNNGGVFSSENIRWRWPRIEKAGVLNSTAVTAAGTDYILTLRAGHAKKFVIGEKVYLKKRIMPQPAPVSPELLPALIPNNQMPASFYSPELTVTAVDTTNGITIQVSGLTSLTHVAVNSVLLKPHEDVIAGVGKVQVNTAGGVTTVTGGLLGPDGTCFLVQAKPGGKFICNGQPSANILTVTSDTTLTIAGPFPNISTFSDFSLTPPPAERYKELISYTIRNAIAHNDRPMTIYPCSPLGPAGAEQVPVCFQVTVDAAKNWSYYDISRSANINSSQIVGLFHGGSEMDCGVFHPTGSCLMRDNNNTSNVFCPICRYVITDMVDPSCHGKIDDLYSNIYPKI